MVLVRVEETIAASCEQVLEMVMNIECYAQVDRKINPILWSRRDGDTLTFACRPKLVGLRQPKLTQYARLTPGRRIDIGLMPLPDNRLAHALADFHASFQTTPVDGATKVVRTLSFSFSPWVRWLLEPLFARRLESEVRQEIQQAKHYLEHPDRQA